jgi:carboxylesterase
MDTAEKSYTDLASRSACVIVGGESMGALLALWLASLHPEIRGVLLFAPALRVPALRWVEWVSPFMQEVQKKNIDEEMAWQGYPVYPLKGAVQLLRLQRSVAKRLGSVCQPMRIFQGRLDQTIDPGCGETILKGVRSRDKEIIWMENSGHCILLDRELETVLASSIQFIQMVSR